MGLINQLPTLLHFTPQQPPPAAATAGSFLSSASQYVDPSIRAAAGAAAAAAASSAVGAAVAAAGAAWPAQVAANYLCLLETARLLLAPVHAAAAAEDQQAQVGIRHCGVDHGYILRMPRSWHVLIESCIAGLCKRS